MASRSPDDRIAASLRKVIRRHVDAGQRTRASDGVFCLISHFQDGECGTVVVLQVPRLKLEEPLTPRETDVAALVGKGLTNGEIGKTLKLSEKTVNVHVRRLYTKVRVRGRTKLAMKLQFQFL